MGIIPHVTIGDNFEGAVGYLTEGRSAAPSDKQATLLLAVGVRTSSAAAMSADFELGQRANPDLRQAVWTSSLSFNPDDLAAGRLPPARQLEIMRAFCQKMGVVDTQLVVMLHGDTDKAHVHLVANRIDNQGRTISDSLCQWRAQLVARELVAEFGLTPSYGNRPELQHPERAVGQPARASAFMRQGLAYGLQQATSRAQLQAGLASGGVEMRGTEQGISFRFEGVAVKGSQVGREFSAAAIDRQLAANLARQQAAAAQTWAEQQAAEAVLARMRPAQLNLEVARKEVALAEQRSDYGQVATIRYGVIPAIEEQLAADRTQAAATPGGVALLAVFDAEVRARAEAAGQAQRQVEEMERVRAQALATQAAQQQQAEQAQAAEQRQAEAAAADVARERRRVEDSRLDLAQATQQAVSPARQQQLQDHLRQAEQQLATCQARAETSEAGRMLLQQQQQIERKREWAGQVLGALAAQGGSVSLSEFNERAIPVGYYLPSSHPGHVVELSSKQLLEMPVVGHQRLNELLDTVMQQEQDRRLREQHEQNQWAHLKEAQAHCGHGYEVVRVRVLPGQVTQVQQAVGDKARVDPQPGADGRLGITILYNVSAVSGQVSHALEIVRDGGGEVFERPQDAQRREQNTQADYARLAAWRELGKQQSQEHGR